MMKWAVLFSIIFFAPFSLAKPYQEMCLLGSDNLYGNTSDQFRDNWVVVLEEINLLIPRLSPRESEWLDKELNSENADRIYRAISSEEYDIREAKRVIVEMLAIMKSDLISESQSYLYLLNALSKYDQTGRDFLRNFLDNEQVEFPAYSGESIRSRIFMALHPRNPYMLPSLHQYILNCFLPASLNKEHLGD